MNYDNIDPANVQIDPRLKRANKRGGHELKRMSRPYPKCYECGSELQSAYYLCSCGHEFHHRCKNIHKKKERGY